jgi:hypothetical protein
MTPRRQFLLVLLFAVYFRSPTQAEPQGLSQRAPDVLVVEGKPVGKRVPAKPGDICLVCYQPVDEKDAVYLVGGQRVALHFEAHEATIREQLGARLAQLKPRGAFLQAGAEATGLSRGWFLAGLYVLSGLVIGGLAAHRALQRGYNPIAWFAAGLLFSFAGYLFLLTRPKKTVFAPAGIPAGLGKIASTYAPLACPACGAENHPSATQCGGCGARLQARVLSEAARVLAGGR